MDDPITAIHEAGHAVVGTAVGLVVVEVSTVPPMTRFTPESVERVSRQAQLAARTAGHLAESILRDQPTHDAFDNSLGTFFEHLGADDVDSLKANGIASGLPEDDVHAIAWLISLYSTPPRVIGQFRLGRARALCILVARWTDVEELAHRLRISTSIDGPIRLDRQSLSGTYPRE
jgi:hypothetical protein